MIIDNYNQAEAIAALSKSHINTRVCVTVKPEGEVFRFVREAATMTLERDGDTPLIFHPVPYAEFAPISSGDGRVADTTTITFNGADITSQGMDSVDSVLQSILEFPLRDRPIQIGLLVLDADTHKPIGIIPRFIGFIDNVPFSREKTNQVAEVMLEFNLVSFRAYAQRQFVRTYSDTDHRTRFPGDGAAKHISNAVFRNGKYAWNQESATGAGGIAGGGGGRGFDTTRISLL